LPETEVSEDMLKLSPYSIGIYQQCPRRYKYQYIDRLIRKYRKPWPWMTMGTNVRAALTEFFWLIPPGARTHETIEDLLRMNWRRNCDGFADSRQEGEYGERAMAQLRRFAETQNVDIQPQDYARRRKGDRHGYREFFPGGQGGPGGRRQ
jgi:hypothetical protein